MKLLKKTEEGSIKRQFVVRIVIIEQIAGTGASGNPKKKTEFHV